MGELDLYFSYFFCVRFPIEILFGESFKNSGIAHIIGINILGNEKLKPNKKLNSRGPGIVILLYRHVQIVGV